MVNEPEKRDKETEHLPHIMTREETAMELRERASEDSPRGRRRTGNSSGVMPYVFTIILVILSIIVSMQLGVSKKDSEKNYLALTALVDVAKKDIKASQDAVNSAVNNIPHTVATQVTTALEQIKSQVSSIESIANNANQRADDATRQYDSINSNLQSLTNSITDLSSKLNAMDTKLAGADNNLNSLKTQLTALSVALTALETRIKALEDKHIIPPSGGGIGGDISVYASSDTDTYKVSIPSSATDNKTVSDVIDIEIKNNTTQTIDDIAIGLTLQIYYLNLDRDHSITVTLSSLTSGVKRELVDYDWDDDDYFAEFSITKTNINLAAGKTKHIQLTLSVIRDNNSDNAAKYYEYNVDAVPST